MNPMELSTAAALLAVLISGDDTAPSPRRQLAVSVIWSSIFFMTTPFDSRTVSGMDISDRWLRTFVAVADTGSFTAAGKRLGVGQPAVSHAVSRLEAGLGVTLIERSTQGLTLTTAGAFLHERLSAALADVDGAVRAVSNHGGSDTVTLSVSTSLANFWLLPRLPDFKRLHPEIELRVITTDSDDSVGLDDADLWIPLGLNHPSHLEATRFRAERIVPVAAPDLADRITMGREWTPELLLDAPLLHLEERYVARYQWHRWFVDNGVEPTGSLPGYRSNDYSLVLQAALDGQGVALGWLHIVTRLLADERLKALSDPIDTGQPFPLLHRSTDVESEHGAKVTALKEWLRDSP